MVSKKKKKVIGKEAKNASWIIGGKIIQMVLSFFVGILTARYLGPSNYGLISYGTAYVGFFTSLCTLGINSVIIKDFVDNPDEQGKTIGSALVMRIIASMLSNVMIFAVVSIVDKNEKETIIVTMLCSFALIFNVFETFNYWFQSRYESKISSIVTLIAYIITSIYKIILLITNQKVQWFAFATSIDYICVAVLLFVAYYRSGGPKLSCSWFKCKQILSKSYHYILSGMMIAIYGQTDKFMIKQMLGEKEVGYYSLAFTLNGMWVFVLVAIIDSMYPTILNLYKTDREEFDKKNRLLYAIVIYLSAFVAILFLLFGKLAIVLLYGEEYSPASDLLSIIAWYTIFAYLGVARNAWIVCYNKQKYLKYMYFSAAIINVILNILLIPGLGAMGAAIASLITQIMTSMILPCFWKDMRQNTKLMIDAFTLKNIK